MNCTLPHDPNNYDLVISKLREHIFPNLDPCGCDSLVSE
jgi:hypothetical protein